MFWKPLAAKIFAQIVVRRTRNWAFSPARTQDQVFKKLIRQAAKTSFGKDHDFLSIINYADFVQKVPIRDYEGLRNYIDRVVSGEKDVLWPEKPLYLAKTSGTTSGSKYIPISKESIKFHISAARDALLHYIARSGKADFVKGKHIFLQGSPVLEERNGIKLGRLSGIAAHYVPRYLQHNRMPKWETNCIEDWEQKVDTIVEETLGEPMTLISGIPSWVQMYFERIKEKTNRTVGEVFPNFNLLVYGGVNFGPYRAKFEKLIGRKVDGVEVYPASEGFFAYQDGGEQEGLLLLLNSGIFYEFVEVANFNLETPRRLRLSEVSVGVNYVMIVSTNAGLWAYNLGDTVEFVTLNPYRIIVTGRLTHFISAFGEHVIGKEVDQAMKKALEITGARVSEFTVAPQVAPETGLPYHEWFVEFDKEPEQIGVFIEMLDKELRVQNSYYDDLIVGKVLRQLVLSKVKKGGFEAYMKSLGKLGGQNKVPRLSNDRNWVEGLIPYLH